MRVDPAYPASVELLVSDEFQRLFVRGRDGEWQRFEVGKGLAPVPQVATSKLADNKGMRQHQSFIERFAQLPIANPEVIDPDRRIGKNHWPAAVRRLGTARRLGSVPPRAARRLAASLAIRASRPACTNAV